MYPYVICMPSFIMIGWEMAEILHFEILRKHGQTHTHTHTHTQTDRQTDRGITIPRPPPMGGEVIRRTIVCNTFQRYMYLWAPKQHHDGLLWSWYFLTRSSICQPISEWLLFILHVGYIQFVIILSKYFNTLKYDWPLVFIFYSHYAHYNKREDYQYVITALTTIYYQILNIF